MYKENFTQYPTKSSSVKKIRTRQAEAFVFVLIFVLVGASVLLHSCFLPHLVLAPLPPPPPTLSSSSSQRSFNIRKVITKGAIKLNQFTAYYLFVFSLQLDKCEDCIRSQAQLALRSVTQAVLSPLSFIQRVLHTELFINHRNQLTPEKSR